MARKGKMTEYNREGINIINTIPTYRKEEEFVAENDAVLILDESKPSKMPLVTFPMNSVGLNLGIKFHLGKK